MPRKFTRPSLRFFIGILGIVLFGFSFSCALFHGGEVVSADDSEAQAAQRGYSTKGVEMPLDERDRLAKESLARSRDAMPDWPATPEALITAFWDAASHKDWPLAIMYVPGAVEGDFSPYNTFKPSPVREIGQPVPDPANPAIFIYPIRVDFPLFRGKKLTMSLTQAPDGRWIIQGDKTKWW